MKILIKEKKLCISSTKWEVKIFKLNDEFVEILYYKNNNKFFEKQELMNFEIFSDMFSFMFCSEDEIFIELINAI
jgi:hypothetical protein